MKISNPTAVIGENLAVEYLQKKGYTIIDRNFRKTYGEIDIIATHNNVLIFVEVKTRKGVLFGTPLESISPWKLREVMKTALYYKQIHPKLPEALRIDAISVLLNAEDKIDTIEHVENISV
jgi:putative endonuclease